LRTSVQLDGVIETTTAPSGMRAIVGEDGKREKWDKVRRGCTKGHVVDPGTRRHW